ncbi:unnamed protein product [Lota lota]
MSLMPNQEHSQVAAAHRYTEDMGLMLTDRLTDDPIGRHLHHRLDCARTYRTQRQVARIQRTGHPAIGYSHPPGTGRWEECQGPQRPPGRQMAGM